MSDTPFTGSAATLCTLLNVSRESGLRPAPR